MKNLKHLGISTAIAATIAMASGTAFAQPQETGAQAPPQRSESQERWLKKSEPVQQSPQQQQQQQEQPRQHSEEPGVDDAEELHDNPDVESGDFEEGMVVDGQHSDHLHWSQGTLPLNGAYSDRVIGSDVLGGDNEVVGQVVDVILDDEDRILELVVQIGEVMGLGSRKVAIGWHELQPVHAGGPEFRLLPDTDLDSLKDAPPKYERD